MKTIIIIIVILGIVLFCDFWSMNFFEDELEFYTEIIDSMLDDINNSNYETLEKDIESIDERWEKRVLLWNITSDHNEVENIAMYVHTSKALINSKMYDDAIVDLTQLKYSFKCASTRYVFILGNIL